MRDRACLGARLLHHDSDLGLVEPDHASRMPTGEPLQLVQALIQGMLGCGTRLARPDPGSSLIGSSAAVFRLLSPFRKSPSSKYTPMKKTPTCETTIHDYYANS